MSFPEQLQLEHPIVQAGMGGGIATGELAGAVSAAGALGTVGMTAPAQLKAQLAVARERTQGRPVAANLLVPFVTRAHVEACSGSEVAAVILHAGFDHRLVRQLKEAGRPVVHTVGHRAEAKRALAEGADALIVQGREAGGHLVGVEPALDALARVLEVVGRRPVLLAGGIADGADGSRPLDAGAAAPAAGTPLLPNHGAG